MGMRFFPLYIRKKYKVLIGLASNELISNKIEENEIISHVNAFSCVAKRYQSNCKICISLYFYEILRAINIKALSKVAGNIDVHSMEIIFLYYKQNTRTYVSTHTLF